MQPHAVKFNINLKDVEQQHISVCFIQLGHELIVGGFQIKHELSHIIFRQLFASRHAMKLGHPLFGLDLACQLRWQLSHLQATLLP